MPRGAGRGVWRARRARAVGAAHRPLRRDCPPTPRSGSSPCHGADAGTRWSLRSCWQRRPSPRSLGSATTRPRRRRSGPRRRRRAGCGQAAEGVGRRGCCGEARLEAPSPCTPGHGADSGGAPQGKRAASLPISGSRQRGACRRGKRPARVEEGAVGRGHALTGRSCDGSAGAGGRGAARVRRPARGSPSVVSARSRRDYPYLFRVGRDDAEGTYWRRPRYRSTWPRSIPEWDVDRMSVAAASAWPTNQSRPP